MNDISHLSIWLADSYDTLPDFDYHPTTSGLDGTIADKIDDGWQSPFIGMSLNTMVQLDIFRGGRIDIFQAVA